MKRNRRSTTKATLSLTAAALSLASLSAAELIYQENFNTDGTTATPQRYTVTGGEVFEIDRRAELNDANQEGPVYWARNTQVSYTGVPAPTGARRMVMAWDAQITSDVLSTEMSALINSSIRWLLNNKTPATIIASPSIGSIGALADLLAAAGYNVIEDNPGVPDNQLQTLGDMLIHAVGAPASRGARATIPVLALSSADHDDLLVSSIGTATSFEAGKATITAPGHPAAGGRTGEFDVAAGTFNWQLIGPQIPGNATVVATFKQNVSPSVTSIADVDAMLAGTKQNTKVTESANVVDFADLSPGDWFDDLPIPGGPSGNWGLVVDGKINVSTAGTYSFALGTDDGGRVQIDVDKDGFESTDTIITDQGPHAHARAFGNATFPTAGIYDIRVVAYNSGGSGSVELWVANTAGAGKNDLATAPENWEVLGLAGAVSPVKAEGSFAVSSYVATGQPDQVTHPLIMLLNGPNDTPPGSVFGGGPFTGFEGTGFFGGAGLNKWALPETGDRYVTLPPINVAGKTNVQLSIAVAGTFLDFEPSNGSRGSADYLEVAIDPDASGPKPFQRLIFFTPPSGSDKFMDDRQTNPTKPTRLGLAFQDVTYAIPADATQLVIEVRSNTTWWNEIVAFDNIRVTAGEAAGEPTLSVAKQGNNVVVTYGNGTLQRTTALASNPAQTVWTDVTAPSPHTVTPAQQTTAEFFRVRRAN